MTPAERLREEFLGKHCYLLQQDQENLQRDLSALLAAVMDEEWNKAMERCAGEADTLGALMEDAGKEDAMLASGEIRNKIRSLKRPAKGGEEKA